MNKHYENKGDWTWLKGNISKSKDFVVAIFKKLHDKNSEGIAHFGKVLLCKYCFSFFFLITSHNTSWPLHNIILVHTECFRVDLWDCCAGVGVPCMLDILRLLSWFIFANTNFTCPFLHFQIPRCPSLISSLISVLSLLVITILLPLHTIRALTDTSALQFQSSWTSATSKLTRW